MKFLYTAAHTLCSENRRKRRIIKETNHSRFIQSVRISTAFEHRHNVEHDMVDNSRLCSYRYLSTMKTIPSAYCRRKAMCWVPISVTQDSTNSDLTIA